MAEMTVGAELAWRIAAIEAQRARAAHLGVEHMLIGLLSLEKALEPSAGLEPAQRLAVQQEQEQIAQILAGLSLEATTLRRALRDQTRPTGGQPSVSVSRDTACQAVFARAEVLARDASRNQCGVLHLLAAVLEQPPAVLRTALEALAGPVDLSRLAVATSAARVAAPGALQDERMDTAPSPAPAAVDPILPSPDDPPQAHVVPAVLLQYGRDLTAEAEAGTLPPVIGRESEMLQVVRILHRRTRSSPVLIGDAGVGKTAIVEGLARAIVEGTALPSRRIVALSLASVVAGTTYRGQFEERLEAILAALRGRPDIILFLDELHTIVGAGDRDGRLDAANILKPALARGEVACIGATTQDEYRRHIESDPALERRFQPVQVLEPSPAEARTMLEGLRLGLERHHGVTIQPDALDAAVALTVRYVPMRRLPDKAIEVLDEACTRAVIPGLTSTPPLPADLFDGSQPLVTEDTVSEVVAAWTGIPVGRLGPAEADRLADLEAHLAARVVGQPAAIQRVAQRVRLARAGLTAPERPAGVFLFLGPSGVGKTELAQALADMTLGGATRLIRLDMSEYAEQHATARLIGAPPGYQGYGDEGQLSGPLRRTPHAVVLLDEVEKAHPDIFDLFLQLFDAGRLTDGSGRPVDGRQAIFVLTSNLVVSAPGRRALGFGGASGSGGDSSDGDDREALLSDLRQFFRPELLNRIDEIVLFRALGEADLREIMRRRLHELQRRLVEQHGIHLGVSEATLALLTRRAVAGSGGAREVQRLINRLIQEPLSRNLLASRYRPGERLFVDASADGVTLVSDAG